MKLLGWSLVVVGFVYICIIISSVSSDDEEPSQIDPSRIPMDAQTVQYLCDQFMSIYIEAECSGETPAYESSFFIAIREGFQMSKSTYDEVQGKIGNFQVNLEHKSASYGDEGRYFVSRYDFHTGETAYMEFFFYSDGRLMKVDFINWKYDFPISDD